MELGLLSVLSDPVLELLSFSVDGIDIHGDFQLSIDRTNLRLDDEVMGPYNSVFLESAAELYLLEVLRNVE
ncbi:hypothetical protein C474_13704 [Halogeometricum pallidum JCM 14848]|uniref:Uncharacterized protein n=1 Tax=Halogeometricum pallidum JCM 14848 TaxID=1227487 RepID=M0D0D6_HALPD|nr:hypothetical protein C474_13704 [Halogeometricum pallidum JCM 14848]